MTRLAAVFLAAAGLAGCGGAQQVREPDLVLRGAAPTPASRDSGSGKGRVAISVVTHGQASSNFWTIVRNGIDAAARQSQVQITYRSPDVYDLRTMAQYIDEAVASRPDGLIVSLPGREVVPAVRAAVRAGIPVVSINSGSALFRDAGALAHIGQPEEEAGFQAGRRLVAAGAKNALCVNHEVGNEGLDQRCRGFARALQEAGGVSRVLDVDEKDRTAAARKLALAAGQKGVDGVLTLSDTTGEIAAPAVPRRVVLGTFDVSTAILREVGSGRIEFAVDQQPYLQGYLPVMLLAERIRHGLFPAEGKVIPTGPSFVTKDTAARTERLAQEHVR